MPFSLPDIDYFLAVVRHGHLGRAAQECGVTQPAITKALRRLEDTVGVLLFERGAHGARLTGEGRLFHEQARRVSMQHDELTRVSEELRAHHSGLLRLGVTNPTGDSDTVRAMAEMLRRRPGVRIRLIIGKSDALNAAILAGDLDLAVVPCPAGITYTCDQIDLDQDSMLVVARTGHPVLQHPQPGLDTLADYGWLMPSRDSGARRTICARYERAGMPEPRVMVEAEYMSEAALGLVAATDLLALCPAISLRAWAGRIEAVPVEQLAFTRRLLLLSRPGGHWSALMEAFRDLLLRYSRPAA
ncbi:LysR family transcriptional regulator [Bordetella genomosp. 13]|uniref:HTH lysR-type domain-containing protein n=1 Tax=Bordetella genomosp. 13 TaxID=463040 RepID=A0A1W6ZCT9_9BORD|nr:LysR family transcriptional regulator [Bordetella genomosp. 13]ARP95181.1 hypothetical protein CAL15_12795 [Bordetella genomosp. 13]